GLEQLFGSEQVIVGHIKRAFDRKGLRIRVGVADTLGAAWACAHYGESPTVIPPGKTSTVLADLPLAALRLPPETVEIFMELGIEHIGRLLSLPLDALASRFDAQVLLRLNQATGLVPETIASHRPPPEITADTALEYPIEDRSSLEVI